MVGLLRGCRAKIERADEGVKNLDREISAFLGANPKPYLVTHKLDDEARNYVFSVRQLVDIPDRFSVLVGEIAHNLRSSLDLLFAALVIRAGNTVEKRHQFPIHTKASEYRKACKKGAIQDVSVSAQKIISAVQPCNAPGTPANTILAAVQALNNVDKHRFLVDTAKAATLGDQIEIGPCAPGVEIIGMGPPSRVKVTKDGVEFWRISLSKPASYFEAKADVAVQIVFEQCGAAKFLPVTDVLYGMVAGVTHTINEFWSEFDADD